MTDKDKRSLFTMGTTIPLSCHLYIAEVGLSGSCSNVPLGCPIHWTFPGGRLFFLLNKWIAEFCQFNLDLNKEREDLLLYVDHQPLNWAELNCWLARCLWVQPSCHGGTLWMVGSYYFLGWSKANRWAHCDQTVRFYTSNVCMYMRGVTIHQIHDSIAL